MLGVWPAASPTWSVDLRDLVTRLRDLDVWFLSWATDGRPVPTATTDLERAHLDSFNVLSHATVERYLEDRVLEFVDALVAKAQSAGDASAAPAMGTLAWTLPNPNGPKVRIQPGDLHLLEESANRLRKVVDNNNGIKATNLGRMIEPVGIAVGDLGTLLAPELTEAGKDRGTVAHGKTIGAVIPVNAADVVGRYVRIVGELHRLEAVLLFAL